MTDDETSLPDPLLTPILRLMDLAIVEWLADGSYVPLAQSPAWFRGATPWSSLPFLEHFVAEARRELHDSVSAISDADQFTAHGHDEELLLRVRAVKLQRRLILIIERLSGASDPRPLLREARERALDQEALTERARAIHAPLDAAANALADLQRQTISDTQQPAVEALARAVAKLKDAAAALPEPRKRR